MASKQRAPEYKPLLYTTTLRNPTRAKCLLNVFSRYNWQKLTEKLCIQIMGDLISLWLYRPTKSISPIVKTKRKSVWWVYIWNEILSEKEVTYILNENYQNHKEFWFPAWWPTRLATIYDLTKELWFVYFNYNESIEFSKIWLMLAESISINVDDDGKVIYQENNPRVEQQVFLHAFVKSQRCNPFVRVLNDNVPLLLLLQTINLLNADKELNSVGISKMELPLLIFWKDNNAESLYKTIKILRKKYGSRITPEIIIDYCINVIMSWIYKKFDAKTIIVDYPDEFIRKMRMTWLISIRWGWRYIDINKNEEIKIGYILKNYSNYKKYNTEKDYFNYMAEIDKSLIEDTTKKVDIEENNKKLDKRVLYYKRENIKKELLILSWWKKLSEDWVLKYLTFPTRLEFLTSLAIKAKYPNIKVIPNYPCDDEWIPTSTAWWVWDKWDIECEEDNKWILVEVTMIEWRWQTIAEWWPVERHLLKYSQNYKESMCYFVAPTIFIDTSNYFEFRNNKVWLNIISKGISEFIDLLENNKTFYSN